MIPKEFEVLLEQVSDATEKLHMFMTDVLMKMPNNILAGEMTEQDKQNNSPALAMIAMYGLWILKNSIYERTNSKLIKTKM